MSSAWALVENEGEFLFVRRAFQRGRGGQWCPPGGTMWKREPAEVACVREAYEETRLRVRLVRPLAVFGTSHYFLCELISKRERLKLRQQECIDYRWIRVEDLLELGSIMDLRQIAPVLRLVGYAAPPLPRGLRPATPDRLYEDFDIRRSASAAGE